MVDIKSGMMADMTFEGDETKSQVPSRETIIYSVADTRIILSQTMPPLTDAQQGKRFLLTFLQKSKGPNPRCGFWAKLIGLLTDYELAPSQLVPALVMARETDPTTYNLRMSYRIRPLLHGGLSIMLRGVEVNIVDISVGGVLISTTKSLALKPQDMIALIIRVDDRKLDLKGLVIRVWSSQSAFGAQQFASIQFFSNEAARESLLGRKILLMERERLAHGI